VEASRRGKVAFDPIPQINVNPGSSVSFLSHAGGTLPASVKMTSDEWGYQGLLTFLSLLLTATYCDEIHLNILQVVHVKAFE